MRTVTIKAVQNLHGTIYRRFVDSVDSNIIYHCNAAPTAQALEANAVWTIFRQDLTTGKLTVPEVGGEPHPDNNICSDVENLDFFETFDALTLVLNSSGDPIENSNNDEIFT